MKLKIIAVFVLMMLLVSCAAETDVGDDGNRPAIPTETPEISTPDSSGLPSAPTTTTTPPVTTTAPPTTTTSATTTPPPAPEPPREEIRIPWSETGLSLIANEETELITELKVLINKFWYPLLPDDDITEVHMWFMIGLHDEYVDAGFIEPFMITEEKRLELNSSWTYILEINNLDFIFNYIFSKNVTNIIPAYREGAREDGLIGVPFYGNPGGHQLILKEQVMSEEKIDLYFYCPYWNAGENGFLKDMNDIYNAVGYLDYIEEEQLSYAVFYKDVLSTLGIVKYTFILEDGKYKILSIENVT